MQLDKLHSERNFSGKVKPKKGNVVSEDLSTGLLKRKGAAAKDGIKVLSLSLSRAHTHTLFGGRP